MGFSEAVRTVYVEKYATFSGRASRSEYWWSVLAVMIIGLIATALLAVTGNFGGMMYGDVSVIGMVLLGIFGLLYLAAIIPMIAVVVRRFHDRNMSGWWYLAFIVASMIPFVGFVASIGLLVLMCLKGTDGENRFGPDPLAEGSNADVFA